RKKGILKIESRTEKYQIKYKISLCTEHSKISLAQPIRKTRTEQKSLCPQAELYAAFPNPHRNTGLCFDLLRELMISTSTSPTPIEREDGSKRVSQSHHYANLNLTPLGNRTPRKPR
ncbi:hypothetical protein F2P56_008771, partial [Juglans regia]